MLPGRPPTCVESAVAGGIHLHVVADRDERVSLATLADVDLELHSLTLRDREVLGLRILTGFGPHLGADVNGPQHSPEL